MRPNPHMKLPMTLPMTLLHAALAATVLAAAPAALAGSVFLNGVNIDGLTNQKFENASVVIDAKGNILITAKGYEVQAAPRPGPAPKAAPAAEGPRQPVTKRYFLVTEASAPGMAQYDIDVFVNATWIKRIAHDDQQVILDISKHLKKGKNSIHFAATKNIKEGRKSTTPMHYLKVHVGEGNMGGNNVMIENQLVEYTRTAAELANFAEDFEIVGE
jgi:hypothetical protein